MKKVMLLAAMLAMVLAAAAPAFAQTVTQGDDGQAQFLACSDVLDVGGDLTQYDGVLNVNQICTQAGEDAFVNVATGEIATANQVVGSQIITLSEFIGTTTVTGTTTVLPDTGGASLLALGAGTLLVAGGLLARRIVR